MEGAKLRLSKYSVAYRQRLLEGGTFLQHFLRSKNSSLERVLTANANEVDCWLEAFVNSLYDIRATKKGALRIAKHGVLFIQVVKPRFKQKLNASWATIKAWEEQRPSQLRSPLPIVLLVSILCRSRLYAERAEDPKEQHRWRIFSCLVGLGFFGMLRPGEILKLRHIDVGLPNQLSFGAPCITLRITKPKNFRQLGHSQFVVIVQPDVCNWVTWACSTLQNKQDLLWDDSAARFRRMFKKCVQSFLRVNSNFTPASLRAGGATFMFDCCQDVGRLRLAGRWASPQSLEHYIQVAKAQQLTISINASANKKISNLLLRGSFLLHLPSFLSKHLNAASVLGHGFFDSKSVGGLWGACRNWGKLGQEV